VARAKLSLQIAFGRAVRQCREEAGLSQEELGHRSGLARNHVGEIERGELNPTLKSIDLIARTLGIEASELVARAEALTAPKG
jgi:transcriptional regulator with XRE-family HTH domain